MSTSSLWPVLPGVTRVPGPGSLVRVRSSSGSGTQRAVWLSQVTLPLRLPGRTGPPRPPTVSPRADRAPGVAQVAPTARGLEAARLGGEGKPGARGVPLGRELGASSARRAPGHAPVDTGPRLPRKPAPSREGSRGLRRERCGLEKRASVVREIARGLLGFWSHKLRNSPG